jgi:hypothetical protein
MVATLSVGLDPVLTELRHELVAGRRLAGQALQRDRLRAHQRRRVQAEVVKPLPRRLQRARGCYLEHPAEVLGRDEVQRATHGKRAHDLAGLEGGEHIRAVRSLGANSGSPEGVREVLGLQRQQVAYGLGDRACGRGVNALGEFPEAQYFARAHLGRHRPSMSCSPSANRAKFISTRPR